MKTYMVILGMLLSVIADTARAESFSPSQVVYRNGIQQLERGEFSAASESFYAAIQLAPEPATSPQEYLPYVNLSISLYKNGQMRAARDALIQSQVYGVAANTETGRQLLDRYAADIMSAKLDDSKFVLLTPSTSTETLLPVVADESAPESQPETMAAYDDPMPLPDDDGNIKRCDASFNRANNKLPWFYYYQCGVELMNAGEAQLAIVAFEQGAHALEDPRRGKRMYGMWFIDYLPYYQMALAYSQLGNWESANNAIQTSETRGEFSPNDPDYDSFAALDQLIKSNLKNNDS